MSDDFPAHTTSVLLTVPGDFDGLRRLLIYGDQEGLIAKMRSADGLPFQVERVGRNGRCVAIWLNPSAIAYFSAGPPLGELGGDGE